MSEDTIPAYLAQNPKMAGVLFTMLLLLTQAGNAAASWVQVTSGP